MEVPAPSTGTVPATRSGKLGVGAVPTRCQVSRKLRHPSAGSGERSDSGEDTASLIRSQSSSTPREVTARNRKRRWRMRLAEHPFGIQTDSTAAAMPNSEAVANGKNMSFGKRMFERIERRIWPTGISTLFVTLGLLYTFRWGPDVGHVPSLWIEPSDLAQTFRAAAELAHGHLSAIYQAGPAGTFVDYPGVLIALAPLGALSNVFHGSAVAIIANHLLLAHPSVIPIYPGSQLAESGPRLKVSRTSITTRRSLASTSWP